MAEITSAGYQSIRDFVENNWKFIELRDSAGTPVLRIDTSDSRVSWEHTAGSQVLELKIVVKGSDAEVTLPQEFAQSAIFSDATGSEAYSVETFSSFTMESDGDELTVIHKLEIPQL